MNFPPPGTRVLHILAHSMPENQGPKNGEGYFMDWTTL
jgi:hypothetical protein